MARTTTAARLAIPLAIAVATPIGSAWGEAAAPVVAAADHVVKVDGARNFRDAGGYASADGHVVKRHAFYRSGSLGKLSEEGRRELQTLGVVGIVDLRTTQERGRDGNDWLANAGLGYWAREYGMSQVDMASYFADPAHRTPEAVRAMMLRAYQHLPFEQAASYKVLFAKLAAAGSGAIVVNCTAGKDRTGIATALVLTVLGVPYETIKRDFLLSNETIDPRELQAHLSGPITALPPESAAPLLRVEPGYLDAAFAAIKAKDGSVEGYLKTELGVGPREFAAIRRRLLA
jgi:protein-tyrosine phosphatase